MRERLILARIGPSVISPPHTEAALLTELTHGHLRLRRTNIQTYNAMRYSLIRQGCEGTAKNLNRIGSTVNDSKDRLRMTRVIFSRCAVFGSRFPFVEKLLLFSISCLFSTLNLYVFFLC